MAYIEVSTDDGGFLLFQLITILLKRVVPFLDPILQSIQFLSCIWDVRGDEVEFFKLYGEGSSLLRMLFLRKVLCDCDWKIFGEDSNT